MVKVMKVCITNHVCMSSRGESMECGAIKRFKCSILRCLDHTERMPDNHKRKVAAVGVVERPPVKWKDRVLEYVRERGESRLRGLDHVRKECNHMNK